MHTLVPGFKIAECGERPDAWEPEDGEYKMKVDAAVYLAKDIPTDHHPHWADQIIPIEFKRENVALDPFDDRKENFGTSTDTRKMVRGQIISYAEFIFAVQQRVALFMFVVIGQQIRFVRWDRSGALVTRSFNYVENWRSLCEILWRISNCSVTDLGLDPTATQLYPDDADYQRMDADALPNDSDADDTERDLMPEELADDSKYVFTYVREMFAKSLNATWPRYRVEVPYGPSMRTFLIAKPSFRAKGLAGRGTQGYVAVDCESGELVWLKDTWRAHYIIIDPEGDILQKLNDVKIVNVPTLVCHGDIAKQVTLTPDWWEAKNPPTSDRASSTEGDPSGAPSVSTSTSTRTHSHSSSSLKRKRGDERSGDGAPAPKTDWRDKCTLCHHQHYRLVEKEVARSLIDFKNGRQLIFVVSDCVYAHSKAATNPKTQLLHRDISGGNILILPKVSNEEDGIRILKWTGILADWEMSKPLQNPLSRPRQPERTGTSQFLSIALLSRPKVVEICDELESFFYVIIYYAVRYLRSNLEGFALRHWINAFFNTYGVTNDTGSIRRKVVAVQLGAFWISNDDRLEFNSPMDEAGTEEDFGKQPCSALAALVPRRRFQKDPWRRYDDLQLSMIKDDIKDDKIVDPLEPTKKDKKYSKYVHKHKHMIRLLDDIACEREWPSGDRTPDRILVDCSPPARSVGPTVPASSANNPHKKPKLSGGC
ncbi:hypothetical protein DICSQDRAFT_172045 [Dichomitus squalens LYAD-421 SS1]|uniref:Fungal-type protein kinase domain-containing protein n=1 Tax=Dichomitus squalens (strain LYAD-421) TaxID=732165 RepID=R7SU50_DICSQ|nr:uncharacterized protein DICSQDRAFT_172045 [Dichomitus squalens LYAD-421 SS1]EJF59448.1 hypothetical protein DICSQDRAFT_172045 [Dichomitus squalens LYAD-421 SS1]